MPVFKDDKGNDVEFEEYNGSLVQKGTVEKINKRVEAERDTHTKKYADLETQHKEVTTQFEELKTKHMTDAEKQQLAESERIRKEQELTIGKNEALGKYKNHKIETELFGAISDYDVFNAKQVTKLIKSEFDDIDLLDNEEVVFKKGSKTFTVKEAVKTFLEDEANANLLKSTLKPGGGTPTGDKKPGAGKTVTQEQFDGMKPVERAAFMANGGEIK